MKRDEYIKSHLPKTLSMKAVGKIVDELTLQEFDAVYPQLFDAIMQIHESDVSDTCGYGEFSEDGVLPYNSFKQFITETFNEPNEGYWKNWKTLFHGPLLNKDIFEKFYDKMIYYSNFCEGQRFLVNGYVYFECMTFTKESVGFMAWDRAGVYDWLIDFATFDGNKPYFFIPEKLFAYLKERKIEVPNFKERFLCLAYFRGIDGLRWHASIDDAESCKWITKHLESLEERIMNLQ